ncbi:hypothetical protein QCA50_006536 [Cerrena zonata]|uniref:DUF6533 domain-containing protein n=1 Tax=Cerrena zonata TaxID=2478898 RepID=A0AAW0GEB1_9APHY
MVEMSVITSIPLLTLAHHLLLAGYLHIVIVTVWLWDTLVSLSDEVKAFRIANRRMTLPHVIYILSRVLTGGTVLSILVYAATPRVGCHSGAHIIGWFGALATPLNTSLFLIRANAVFMQRRKWKLLFAILWLSTFAALTTPFSFSAANFQIAGFCPVAKVERIGTAGAIAVAIFDTVVFFSITYEIMSINKLSHHRASWNFGTGQVSRTLLLTGQLYYFPVITVNVLVMAAMLSSSVEPQYQTVALVADIAFQNVMACRVFRLLRMGIIYESPSTCSLDLPSGSFSVEDFPLPDFENSTWTRSLAHEGLRN